MPTYSRPEPTTKPPKLPIINKRIEIDQVNFRSGSRCEYCQQSQPDDWNGGACAYCGAPMEGSHYRVVAKGITVEHGRTVQ